MTEERELKTITVTKDMIQNNVIPDLNFNPIEVKPRRKWYKKSGTFLAIALILLLIVQGYSALQNAFSSSPLLGWFYLVIIAFAIWAVLVAAITEISSCATFKQREIYRNAKTKKDIRDWLMKQKYNREPKIKESFTQWLQKSDSYTSTEDIKAAYSELILEPIIDKEVAKIISSNSLQTAAFVATSPFILTDMLFVLASNLRMTNQIAERYGMEISLSVRFKIYQSIFRNMMTSGGAELLTDMASPLTVGLIGKFSAKIGQGMLGGLYAARLGIKVAQMCRPIPFTNKNELSTNVVFKAIYSMFKDRKLIEEDKKK